MASKKRVELLERVGHEDISLELIGEGVVYSHQVMVGVLMSTLLDNARIHCGGEIEIRLKNGGFEIYNDLSNSSDIQPGFGYGMEITRRIVNALEGRVEINGSADCYSVTVDLPICDSHMC